MNYTQNKKSWEPINVNQLPELERKFKEAKGTPVILELKSMYDGPDHGVDYHDETGKFTIASGWHIDITGNIVRD